MVNRPFSCLISPISTSSERLNPLVKVLAATPLCAYSSASGFDSCTLDLTHKTFCWVDTSISSFFHPANASSILHFSSDSLTILYGGYCPCTDPVPYAWNLSNRSSNPTLYLVAASKILSMSQNLRFKNPGKLAPSFHI